MTHKWTHKVVGVAVAAVALLGGASSAHAASSVVASMDCDGVITFTASHAEWGQSMQIQMMGETYTMDRPEGWWDGDGPHDRWSVTGSYQTDGDVTLTWTDFEGGSLVHGPLRVTRDEACDTPTTEAPPTTLAPVVPLPELVVDPTVPVTVPLPNYVAEPLPQLPVGVVVTVDPYSTLPAGVTTSVAENGDVAYSDCVIVVECDDVRFDVVAEAGTADTLPATGSQTGEMVGFGVAVLIVGGVALWAARRRRYDGPVYL